MKISIDDIKKSPENKLEILFDDFIEEFKLKDKVKAYLIATASNYNVIVTGSIKAELTLECARCLNEFDYALDFEINEEFITDNLVPDDIKEFELKEKDFVETLNAEQEIDITDLIYQSIILELPYKTLCNQDCKGFEDATKTEYIDERLEIFKGLIKE